MKELLKVYAPILALAVGGGAYYLFGQVSELKEQTELLREQRDAIVSLVNGQCRQVLEARGFTVAKPQEEENGEDTGGDKAVGNH